MKIYQNYIQTIPNKNQLSNPPRPADFFWPLITTTLRRRWVPTNQRNRHDLHDTTDLQEHGIKDGQVVETEHPYPAKSCMAVKWLGQVGWLVGSVGNAEKNGVCVFCCFCFRFSSHMFFLPLGVGLVSLLRIGWFSVFFSG